MKETFENWNNGGKLIFIGSVLAVLSLFMKWVDAGIISASGFQQQGYLLLVLFVYPLVKLFNGQAMNKVLGLISGGLAIIAGIAFMFSKTVEVFGETINMASTGLYVYIIAAIILTVGIVMYNE